MSFLEEENKKHAKIGSGSSENMHDILLLSDNDDLCLSINTSNQMNSHKNLANRTLSKKHAAKAKDINLKLRNNRLDSNNFEHTLEDIIEVSDSEEEVFEVVSLYLPQETMIRLDRFKGENMTEANNTNDHGMKGEKMKLYNK
jgi:hypothetical protein